MILIDTGFLIALAEPRDALHARASSWLRILSDSLLLSEFVVLETINALSMPADRAKGHRLLDYMLAQRRCEFVRSTPELWRAGVNLHKDRLDKFWSLTDCISFSLMRERSITEALSHDQHFEQAGFRALLRSDPPT